MQLLSGLTRWIRNIIMLSIRTILIALCLLLAVTVQAQTAATEPQTGAPTETGRHNSTETAGQIWYDVSRVVDGDTFWVDDGSEKGMKVRLTGIDAPEPRNTGTRPKAFFGTESEGYRPLPLQQLRDRSTHNGGESTEACHLKKGSLTLRTNIDTSDKFHGNQSLARLTAKSNLSLYLTTAF
jgi:hypothetical protein